MNRYEIANKANDVALEFLKRTPHDGSKIKEVFDAISIHETIKDVLDEKILQINIQERENQIYESQLKAKEVHEGREE